MFTHIVSKSFDKCRVAQDLRRGKRARKRRIGKLGVCVLLRRGEVSGNEKSSGKA